MQEPVECISEQPRIYSVIFNWTSEISGSLPSHMHFIEKQLNYPSTLVCIPVIGVRSVTVSVVVSGSQGSAISRMVQVGCSDEKGR